MICTGNQNLTLDLIYLKATSFFSVWKFTGSMWINIKKKHFNQIQNSNICIAKYFSLVYHECTTNIINNKFLTKIITQNMQTNKPKTMKSNVSRQAVVFVSKRYKLFVQSHRYKVHFVNYFILTLAHMFNWAVRKEQGDIKQNQTRCEARSKVFLLTTQFVLMHTHLFFYFNPFASSSKKKKKKEMDTCSEK